MHLRGIFIFTFLLLFNSTNVFSEVITIESEPPELIQLRKAYELEKQQAISPLKLNQLKEKMTADRQDALRSIPYVQKRRALEAARDQEIAKIKANFQQKLTALEKNALSSLEKKQGLELTALKNKTINQAHTNFIAQLEKLEKQLINKNDLAGALVVQVSRKKAMSTSPKSAGASKPTTTPKVEKKSIKQTPPAVEKAVFIPMSKDNPRTYVSTENGIAGSSGNMKNNLYTFKLDQVGQNSKLIFHAFGKRSTDSYGEVYLTMPSGQRQEVSQWSPKKLKKNSFNLPKSAKDVKPISQDISKYVKKVGIYKIEFKYKDGNDALHIYRVEIQTW